jgi:signal transduction histidine kinase
MWQNFSRASGLLRWALAIAALGVIVTGAAVVTEQQLATLRRYISTIEREINRLDRVVREVLFFARPTHPRWQVVPTVPLLRNSMSAQLSKANIELMGKDSAAPTIQADPDRLKEVLLNLVPNAGIVFERRDKLCSTRESSTRVSANASPTSTRYRNSQIPRQNPV